ncbi:MAG TPA: hypothetical protein VE860_17775, partial [Chthoniobacterales bacterium]|nr:hypothetical protein [Chthoniobacterales bacterium]
ISSPESASGLRLAVTESIANPSVHHIRFNTAEVALRDSMWVDGSRMAIKLKVVPPLQITETIDALYRPPTSPENRRPWL